MIIRVWLFLFFFSLTICVFGQPVINEVVSANNSGIVDEDNEHVDWIEMYNPSNAPVDLKNYSLKDKWDDADAWVFPSVILNPKAFLLVFASGKDRAIYGLKYKTIIEKGADWQYLDSPGEAVGTSWRYIGFNASAWQTGKSGFGYGDNDDETTIKPLSSIYIRKEFQISNLAELKRMVLHVDYDDAFIAFINGEPVAKANLTALNDENTSFTVTTDHEAQMYQGNPPNRFDIDLNEVDLVEGTNVLAIQGYNISAGSSDFTLIPMLTLGSTRYTIDEIPSYFSLSEGELHTNFKVSSEGESLYLFDNNKELIDSVLVLPLPVDVAYGRYPDGTNNWSYFQLPTPGLANTNPVSVLINDSIYFSQPAGFYQQTVQVSLSSNASGVIRYTTNGAEPTATSTLASGLIGLSKTGVIRAALFTSQGFRGEVFTNSYFINSSYKLPVVMLSTEPDNFWGYNDGILVTGPNAQTGDPHYGANYWMDWEKPVHFEYFDKNGLQQISQGAGVKITGGWSRVNTQKSMALYARSIYGKGSFNYALFNDRPFDKFESFIMRNSGNDWFYTMLRDGYVSEAVKNLDVDRLAYQPVVIYLNGEYWGILNMREKPNEHYFASNYDVDPSELNLLDGNGWVVNGEATRYSEMIAFLQNHDLSNNEDYERIASTINIDCFIDYVLIEIYDNNQDWPGNNIKFWNTTNEHSKFRWLLYDTDFGMGIYNSNDYSEDAITFATEIANVDWPNPPWSTLLLRRMLTNADFRIRFVNRMADLLNTTFLPNTMTEKLDSVTRLIEPYIEQHQQKWGRNYNGWKDKVQVIYDFVSKRPSYIRSQFVHYFGLSKTYSLSLMVSDIVGGQIQINTITPSEYPFNGFYFSGIPIQLTARPKPGYRFVKWEGASNSTDIEIGLNQSSTTNLKAIFEPVTAGETVVVINEINYKSNEDFNAGDWVELYNAGSQTVDLSGWYLTDSKDDHPYVFGNGQLLYPKAYLVVCESDKNFTTAYPDIKNHIGNFEFGLGSDGDRVQLMDFGGNIIDQVSYLSTEPWPIEPFSTSATLELKDPQLDNSQFNNWDSGLNGGTPGQKNSTYTSNYILTIGQQQAYCFPTRFSDFTTLCFYGTSESAYTIQLINIQGQVKKTLHGVLNVEGNYYLDIFTASEQYPPGMYLVKVKTEDRSETIKVIKQ